MTGSQGGFVWYELLTTDPQAAAAFYRDVVGWTAEPAPEAPMPYWLLMSGQRPAAGLMALSDAIGAPPSGPNWLGYVQADDVDATARRVGELGGSVCLEPHDIPAVGRFAVVADPQGAVFALMRWAPETGFEAPPLMTGGHAGWHELLAADWPAVYPFYEALFGWRKADAMDMGPMGVYQLLAPAGSGPAGMQDAFGATMTKPPEVPAPFWLYYFSVPSIDACKARVEARGGQVLFGPTEVPGGMWILQCIDPQGAMFAFVGPR